MKILWIWNSCINDLIKSDIFWLFAIVLCEEEEEACAILQLCVENLSFRVTKQTEPKRENIQEKATKKEKENQIVVECSSKIKYPVSWGSIYWGMRSLHSSEIRFSAYLRILLTSTSFIQRLLLSFVSCPTPTGYCWNLANAVGSPCSLYL